MVVFVFSDSHGETEKMIEILQREQADAFIHLGDHVRDAVYVAKRFPQLRCIYVKGNSYEDQYAAGEESRVVELEGHRFFLCYGHRHGVKESLLRLQYAAQAAGTEFALFGHTHISQDEMVGGIRCINPGSISRGYQYGWTKTYARLEVTGEAIAVSIRQA